MVGDGVGTSESDMVSVPLTVRRERESLAVCLDIVVDTVADGVATEGVKDVLRDPVRGSDGV